MLEGLKNLLARVFSGAPKPEPPDADDREAGVPVPVRRGRPDRSSSVAVAEPDDD